MLLPIGLALSGGRTKQMPYKIVRLLAVAATITIPTGGITFVVSGSANATTPALTAELGTATLRCTTVTSSGTTYTNCVVTPGGFTTVSVQFITNRKVKLKIEGNGNVCTVTVTVTRTIPRNDRTAIYKIVKVTPTPNRCGMAPGDTIELNRS